MAWVVTAEASAGVFNSSPALATGSFTPENDALVVVAAAHYENAQTLGNQSLTGQDVTMTQRTNLPLASRVGWNGDSSYEAIASMWTGQYGSSPAADNITATHDGSLSGMNVSVHAASITGHNSTTPIVQAKTNGAELSGGNSESISVVLDSAPTAGNLLICFIFSGADSGGGIADPTAGTGNTFTGVNTSSATFHQCELFYREVVSGDSATISCSDLGQSVGNAVICVIEIATSAATATAEPADATHAHASTQPTVTATATASPADATHAHASTSPTVTSISPASPADATHAHASTEPTVTATTTAAPANATHGHASTQPTVTATSTAAPANAAHGHASTSPTVTAPATLSVEQTGYRFYDAVGSALAAEDAPTTEDFDTLFQVNVQLAFLNADPPSKTYKLQVADSADGTYRDVP